MDILQLFTDAPIWIRIILAIIVSLPTLLGGSSLFLHFRKRKRTHSDCPMYADILIRDDIKAKIKEIKNRTILMEQMNIVASANAKIMFLMRSTYLTLTKCERDINHYDEILETAKKEVKNNLRKWLKVNHYTNKTEMEFNLYIGERINDLLDVVTYHLNRKHKNHYFETPRNILLEQNQLEVIPKALIIWQKMFSDCREIARDNETLILKLEEGIAL
jgi:hypothetical protein